MAEFGLTFAGVLRRLRAAARLTQEELAKRLRDALAIYQRIGVPEAQRVRDTLDELGR